MQKAKGPTVQQSQNELWCTLHIGSCGMACMFSRVEIVLDMIGHEDITRCFRIFRIQLICSRKLKADLAAMAETSFSVAFGLPV